MVVCPYTTRQLNHNLCSYHTALTPTPEELGVMVLEDETMIADKRI